MREKVTIEGKEELAREQRTCGSFCSGYSRKALNLFAGGESVEDSP
jgi:hypothetical protein